jgi:hypothetical protein
MFYQNKHYFATPFHYPKSINFSHKDTQGAQRKEDDKNHPNEKFLEVRKPFFKKVFGRRRQK